MTSVREKKKARTEAALLDAALALFCEQGYASTTVEQIAERAVVGVGTVYNYFGSKDGLLVAVIYRDHHRLLEQGAALVARPCTTAETRLNELLWLYLKSFWTKYDRALLREVFAVSFARLETVGQHMAQADRASIAQIAQLLESCQAAGLVSESLPCAEAAQVAYSSLLMLFMFYVMDESLTLRKLRRLLADNVKLLFDDWRAPTRGK